ncbi:hypothetical protein NDU88_010367 [Pleurodeles waltl]|uniref:Uncharacterized protein n=1 Tax=Pleurodeles waltl TaxID=8319 RepID=A0AAV7S348_PLEWA|nr:hypothetical protein NDU88_010367 [Pleurodeles waltl]
MDIAKLLSISSVLVFSISTELFEELPEGAEFSTALKCYERLPSVAPGSVLQHYATDETPVELRCQKYGSVVNGVPVLRCWKERLEDSTAADLVYKTCRGTIKPFIHGLELTVKSLKTGKREVLIGVCVEEGD